MNMERLGIFKNQLPHIIKIFGYFINIPMNLVQTIEEIYLDHNVQTRINNTLTKSISVNKGIREGDSLSPLLFNIVMDEVIKKI